MLRVGIASLLLCCLPASTQANQPAVIHLRDGKTMRGLIVDETPKNLLLDTPDERRWRIPLVLVDRIQRLMQPAGEKPPAPPRKSSPATTKAAPTPAATKTATAVTTEPASAAKPTPAKKPADTGKKGGKNDTKPTPKPTSKTAPPKKTPAKPPAKPVTAKAKPKGKWNYDIRLGMDLRYTAVTQQTVHSRIKTSYASKHFRNQIDWNFAYGKTADRVSADRMSGLMKTDWTFDSGVYVYHTGSAGYDTVRRVALQYEIGPGVGYHLIRGRKLLFKDSNFSLDIETGGEYEDKLSTTGLTTQRYFWRLAQLIRWNLSKDFTLTEEFEYFPRIGALVNNRYRAEVNFAYRLIKNLTLNLTVLAEADPQRLNDFVPDDLQIRSSLGWRF